MASPLEIARDAPLRPIAEVAAELGLLPAEVEPHGAHAAKVSAAASRRLAGCPDGQLLLVTAITPTPSGEGKTTTAIGLVDALRRLGARAALTLRQPSLGPLFGAKGGASGGGRAQVAPPELVNLHLTGDLHAVAAAHNLAAAMLDNHLHHGNQLGVDPGCLAWPRAVDVNDRALRQAVVGLGGSANGPVRQAEWVTTAASEVMAVLALADDLADLRRRLGRIAVGRRRDGTPVLLEELRAAGAMAALLVEAVKPNLLQTLEGSPVLVHAGPFGNVASGTSSVVADRLALKLVRYVVTEAGFGADLGAEKFFDLKCRQSGLRAAAAILVATVRALKHHGHGGDDAALRAGLPNLARQIAVVRTFGVPVVVAVNAFAGDEPAELETVRAAALAAGARAAEVATHHADGGAGAIELARAALEAAAAGAPDFRLLYPDELPLAAKIETVARTIYRADGVDLAPAASTQLAGLEALGYRRLPVCVAKTPLSPSHDPLLGGDPRGFRLPVREAHLAAGAGFVTAVAGDVQLMPGLPRHPAAEEVDVGADGRITGLR